MLRWIAALMAALLCAYAGIRMSGRLRARVEMLRGALDAARDVFSGVAHTRLPLTMLLRNCDTPGCPVSLAGVADSVERGRTPLEALLDAAYAARPYGWPELTDADKRAAEAFADALSADTRATICECAALAVETLEQRLGEAEAQYQNKGRVYRTLGLLTGAAVAILLL